jgi:hypothetical protein
LFGSAKGDIISTPTTKEKIIASSRCHPLCGRAREQDISRVLYRRKSLENHFSLIVPPRSGLNPDHQSKLPRRQWAGSPDFSCAASLSSPGSDIMASCHQRGRALEINIRFLHTIRAGQPNSSCHGAGNSHPYHPHRGQDTDFTMKCTSWEFLAPKASELITMRWYQLFPFCAGTT